MKISTPNPTRFLSRGARFLWAALMFAWMAPAGAFAAPTVSTTVPATGATAVPLSQIITVTFSEPMNPLTTVTFTVTDPVGLVPGVVSNPTSTTATFTPDYLLAATSVPFTATITTGATAVAGNTPLSSSYVWTFTTGPLAPVNLGSTANFVVLAGADVTNSPTSAITGDVGASPIAGTGITGFGITEVTGTIYTTSAGGPAGSVPDATRLTAAKGDLTIAYGDAAGRTPIPVGAHYLNPGAGNLGGLNLAGGLYKFSGAAGISGSDLTLTGSRNDVWIFQIGSTLTVATGIKVTLAGGAQAANIFWRAPSGATLITGAEMKGTILTDAGIALGTGAKLDGRVMAFTAGITLLSNTIVRPDITVPTVSLTDPAPTVTGVVVNQNVVATFSETMLPSSITTTTFTVTGPGTTPVAGAVTYVDNSATFNPTSALATNVLYTVTILGGSTGAKDSASNPMTSNYVWTFTTGATSDATAPTVSSTVPATAATGVALNQNIAATFSEAMLASTITTTTFTLTGPGTTPVAGAVSLSGATATFDPTSALAANTLFTATITTGAKDLASNALASTYTWTFTTGASADATAPTVSSTVPAAAATGVVLNQNIAATFSEAMLASTITTTTFTLTGPGSTPVAGTVTYTGTTATFNPTSALAANTLFTATITTGATDLASNALASNYVWTFTTGATSDNTAPTVSSTVPTAAATGVSPDQNIAATFSESMLASTITTTTFTLAGPGTTPVAGTVSYSGTTATFDPASDLATNILYTATITTGAKDLAGNTLASSYVWTFTTADNTAPTVSSTSPAPSATGVELNKQISATFSEVMLASTINSTTFTLAGPGTTPVPGAVSYAGLTATFAPSSALAANTTYTGTITTGVKDLAGNAKATAFVWTFTTGAAVDLTAPTVSSTDPNPGATGVARNKLIAATFSEAMRPATITDAIFMVTGPGTTPVPGTVTYVGTTATFTPTSALEANTLFTVSITGEAEDLAGNDLGGYGWSFTTGTAIDLTAPTVSSTATANGATGVGINSKRALTFSESMDPLTITPETFTLTGPFGTGVLGTVTYVGRTATFAPTSPLDVFTSYTATVTTGAKDLGGNPLASDYVWSFTTGDVPDIIAPTMSSTAPAAGATVVALNQQIAATLSEEMDPATITTETFTVTGPAGAPLTGLVTYVGRTAAFAPGSALAANTPYTATITTGAHDLAGNPLASAYAWTFTTGAAADLDAPTVSSTDPAAEAAGVALNKKIAVTLSEVMDPATISTATFVVTGPSGPVRGTMIYVGRTATFTPANALAANTPYTGTITTEVKDLAGNALAADYVWRFDTGAAPDLTVPTMTSLDPANRATGVLRNQQLNATFSESMDPATITTVTYKVAGPGTTPVPGTVTYVGRTATFVPASTLAASTLYTATITTGAKDLAGNARTSDFVWTFTTGTSSGNAQPPLDLLSTADFVILAGSAITNIPISAVNGDIGLSPAAGSFITGFGSGEVTGTIYAVDATYPTANIAVINPTLLAAAKGDLTTAYDEAAGRTPVPTGAFLNPGAGNLGGLTLVPGLYKFTGAALLSGSDLTLNGTATDIWIFQIGSDLTVANGIRVTLAGGARAGNVFWQVGTSATIGVASVMQGTILADQSITLANGATLNGRALAANAAVTLEHATVNRPTLDLTAPTVGSTELVNGATNVPVTKAIAITLSEPMDSTTINTNTFKVTGPGATPVAGTVTYTDTTAIFTPTSLLAGSTLYTATLTTGATDLAGNTLASDHVWTFTTAVVADSTAPDVSTTAPAPGATDVVLNQHLAATLSEEMDPTTINTNTFKVTGPGSTPVPGTVTYVGNIATFAPTSNFAPNTLFTATLTTGAKDLAGNGRASDYVWTFTTGAAADLTAPAILATEPGTAGTNVSRLQQVTVTFSEAMLPSTITASTFSLNGPSGPVLGRVTYAGNTATFAPSAPLAADTLFTATLTTGATDLAGNALASNHVWSFATGIPADFNASGKVDFDDFFLFSDVFGQPATGEDVIYDLDNSVVVDFGDFFLFADDFGRSTGKVVASQPLPVVQGSIELDSRSVEEGLVLGLRAEDLALRGYMVIVEYDPSAFRFELAQDRHSVLRRQGEALLLSREDQRGQVLLLGSGAGQGATAAGLLAELHFAPLRPEAVGIFRVHQALVRDGVGQVFQPEQLGQVEARWVPQTFALQPNYPNPFNPSTTILYQLPLSSPVRLEIYDVLGQRVRTLVAQVQPAGFHRVTWDSRNEGGALVAGGVYFYRLQAGDFVQVRNLMLLK